MYYLIFTTFLIILPCVITVYTGLPKDHFINEWGLRISSWVTPDQYRAIFDKLEVDVYNCLNLSVIGANTVTYLESTLNSSQNLQLMTSLYGLGRELGSNGSMSALNTTKDCLYNNFIAFYTQLTNEITKLKLSLMTMNGVLQNGYRMCKEYETFNRIKTYMTRWSNRFTPTTWDLIFSRDVSRLAKERLIKEVGGCGTFDNPCEFVTTTEEPSKQPNVEAADLVKQMLDYLSSKGMLLITEPSHNHQNQIYVKASEYEHEDMSNNYLPTDSLITSEKLPLDSDSFVKV